MDPEKHHTVFIRLPFARTSFEDPLPVQWDATKDQQLWKVISNASGSELNWDALGERFDVPLSFLLQQAAWLYERHFEGMKAQMKKLNVPVATSPSPATPSLEGVHGLESNVPPAIKTSRILPPALPENDAASPATPTMGKPLISRTPSTNTVTQSRIFASQKLPSRNNLGSRGRLAEEPVRDDHRSSAYRYDRISEPESEDEEAYAPHDADSRSTADKHSGFLPFAASSKTKSRPATSRKGVLEDNVSFPPSSSVSSASLSQNSPSMEERTVYQAGIPNSKNRAEAQKTSVRQEKSGGQDSPSIGSSFSDLNDTGI